MKKFIIGFIFTSVCLSPQLAVAVCGVSGGKTVNTGTQVCRGSSTSNMTVQTCTSNSTFQSSGTKCTCNGGNYDEYQGQYTCMSGYTTSSTSTGATLAKR